MKISSKILSAFVLAAFAVFVVLAASHFVRIRHHFEQDFVRNAKVLAHALEGSITAASDFESREKLRTIIQKTMWLNPDVVRIDINVPQADVLTTLVSSEPFHNGQQADANNIKSFKEGIQVISFKETDQGRHLCLSSPIRSAKKQIGTFNIMLILEVIDQRIFDSMVFNLLIYFALVFASSVMLYLFVRNSIIRRLNQLSQAVGVYGREGVLPDVDVETADEIGDLARDITQMTTDHRETQQRLRQAQRLEAVGQLTGGIAHDFNNILTVIQGNAEMLAKNARAPAKLLSPILQATQSGSDLIKRLLAFSRAQSLNTETLWLDTLVENMSDILSVSAGGDVHVEHEFENGLWPVCADYGEVENAILNLVINARDAMPDGGRILIECRNMKLPSAATPDDLDLPSGDYVCLAVSDTGSGMTEHVAESAFNPFFTTKQVDEGSGLGLSMVYGFAQQSGGHAFISSVEGAGTTVSLYLPRAAVSDDQSAEPRDEEEEAVDA